MKSIEVKIKVYEVGDVLDISELRVPKVHKSALYDAKKALIIDAKQLKDGRYHYKCVTDGALATSIAPDDMVGEKYIGHTDLSMIYDEIDL